MTTLTIDSSFIYFCMPFGVFSFDDDLNMDYGEKFNNKMSFSACFFLIGRNSLFQNSLTDNNGIENESLSSWEAVEERSGASSIKNSTYALNASSVLWVPDHAVNRCNNCKTEFWLGRRKHHCRWVKHCPIAHVHHISMESALSIYRFINKYLLLIIKSFIFLLQIVWSDFLRGLFWVLGTITRWTFIHTSAIVWTVLYYSYNKKLWTKSIITSCINVFVKSCS